MAVTTLRANDGNLRKFKMASSTTIVANSFLTFASGLLTNATATTDELLVIARESKTSGAGETPEILCELLTPDIDIVVDTTGDTSQALVGTKIDLTNATTANQAGVAKKVLLVVGLQGKPSDRKAIVRIVNKA